MSLRDWFAGMAIRTAYQTMADLIESGVDVEDCSWTEIAASAYDAADAMLAERAKDGTLSSTPPGDTQQQDS
jgi:hypothetical protein